MRKFVFAAIVSCLLIPTAFAATSLTVKAVDLIPSDADVVFEFDTSAPNFLETALIELIKMKFEKDPNTALPALIENVFTDNTFIIASKSYDKTNYLMFGCKASDFTAFTQTGYVSEMYNGYTVASNVSEETYASYIKNFCVFTSTSESIKSMIDTAVSGNYQGVSSVAGYKNFTAKKDASSFMSIFINPSLLTSELSQTSGILSALTAEGFAFVQTSTGLTINLYLEGDSAKLTDLNFAFNKYNFVPKLYSKISGNKLIAYIGANNLSGALEDSLELLTQSSDGQDMVKEMYAQLSETLGFDVETELIPVLNGEWLITVHDSGNTIPAFTAVFDVNGNLSKAQNAALLLNQKLKETFEGIETTEQKEFYTNSTKIIQGTTFTEHKFINPDDPEADPFYLNIGVSPDGLLVVSTHPDLAAIYKADSGLTVNSGFKSYFTNPSESIREIFYFDIDVLKNYISQSMTESGADAESISAFNEMMAPWHNVYSKLYANQNQEWGDILIKVDIDKISGVQEMMDSYLAKFMVEPVKFCDVNKSDWFYQYVSDLSVSGVVQGYPDGCFKPGNEITRAEFIKMVLAKKGLYGMYQSSGQSVFKDIKGDEWYAEYVNEAAVYSYIKGYEDGTFRPNDPISRAEALQIISNVNMLYNMQFMSKDEPFTDVNENDWFYDAVKSAYTMGVVQGTSTGAFEPYRHLTRAEAAKMLSLGI